MSEKAYIDIVFDGDGIGYMQMRTDRRYSLGDLAALYKILAFYEEKHSIVRPNTASSPTAPGAPDGDGDGETRGADDV